MLFCEDVVLCKVDNMIQFSSKYIQTCLLNAPLMTFLKFFFKNPSQDHYFPPSFFGCGCTTMHYNALLAWR